MPGQPEPRVTVDIPVRVWGMSADGHPFNHLFRSQPAVVNGTVYIPTSDPNGGNRVDAFRLP